MNDFIHRVIPASEAGWPTVVLLHGTGGDENDLVSLGEMIAPGAALLGVRGKVLENGAPRYFRRLQEGTFDLDDLRFRIGELAAFLEQRPGPLVAVGYSNGANMAAGLLVSKPRLFAGATLLRALLPLEPDSPPDLNGTPVLLATGERDPLISAAGSARLAELLRKSGAEVTWKRVNAGHELTNGDIDTARAWFRRFAPRGS